MRLLRLSLYVVWSACALLVMEVPVVRAQWSVDPAANTRVCAASADQRTPVSVSDGAGGAIIVWEDERNGSLDLYAQRVASDGRLLWNGTVGVPVCTVIGVQQHPDIMATADGGVFIVWEDGRGSDLDIFAQRLDSNGVAQWTVGGMPVCVSIWQQVYPRLSTDGSGGIIVVWQDSRNLGYDVFAQRLNGAGSRQWTPTGVAVCSIEHTHLLPKVVSDGRGGVIVVWEEGRSYISQRDIYAQRLSGSGALHWPTNGVGVCTAFGTQQNPQVVSDGNGGAIIAWQDQRNGSSANAGDIYAQRIDSTGQMLWTVNGTPVCTAIGAQHSLRITADQTAATWLCWVDERNLAPTVFAQYLTHDGQPRWTTGGINIAPLAHNAVSPAIARDVARGMLVGWAVMRPGLDTDLIAQRIDSTGTLLWGLSGTPISTADGNQQDVCLLADGSGSGIFAWTDTRSGNQGADIFAAKTGYSGLIPVELSRLSASRAGGVVTLRWRTEREDGNVGFDVQCSSDAARWDVRGFVAGAPGGNSRLPRMYSFEDVRSHGDDAGVLWYRLRQVNSDGTSSFSPVIVVTAEPGVLDGFVTRLWPQPASMRVHVALTLQHETRVHLQLHDVTGRRVQGAELGTLLAAGSHVLTLPVHALPSGLYLLHVDDGMRVERQLLRIMRSTRD